jgi:Fanconi anemia group M protein
MIYDIFKNKKREEGKEQKPIIILDIHEKNSLVLANLTEMGTELQLTNLEVGDYLINNTIIERKTFSDFISSMLSKRLIEQLKNMQQYEKKLLILEGKQNKEINIHPNAIKGMILSASLELNTPIIQTENEKETATYLFLLAKRQLKPSQELSLHSRIPKTKEEQKRYILESFPEIGPKTAEKLLKEFKTIKHIINSTKENLEKVIGQKAKSFEIIN